MKKEKFASDTSKRSAKDWVRALAVLLGGIDRGAFGGHSFSVV